MTKISQIILFYHFNEMSYWIEAKNKCWLDEIMGIFFYKQKKFKMFVVR
jgi:hypothetical protein